MLDGSVTALEALQRVQDDYTKAIGHQYVSFAAIKHSLDIQLNGTALFNSVMSVIQQTTTATEADQQLDVVPVSGNNPNEFDCTVGVNITDTDISVNLTHWTDKLTPLDAENIGSTYAPIRDLLLI